MKSVDGRETPQICGSRWLEKRGSRWERKEFIYIIRLIHIIYIRKNEIYLHIRQKHDKKHSFLHTPVKALPVARQGILRRSSQLKHW